MLTVGAGSFSHVASHMRKGAITKLIMEQVKVADRHNCQVRRQGKERTLTQKPLFALLVQNSSLQDRVYSALRTAILDMDIYMDGANLRLNERLMAEQLGTSRTSVREALLRLKQEGFIDIRPRKGVVVVRKSMHKINEALESRDTDLTERLVSEHTMKLHRHVCETWLEMRPSSSNEIVNSGMSLLTLWRNKMSTSKAAHIE